MSCIRSYRVTALHDTVFNVRVVPKIHIVQNDGILDHTIVSYKYLFENDGIFHCAINNTSASHKAVFTTAPGLYFAGG